MGRDDYWKATTVTTKKTPPNAQEVTEDLVGRFDGMVDGRCCSRVEVRGYARHTSCLDGTRVSVYFRFRGEKASSIIEGLQYRFITRVSLARVNDRQAMPQLRYNMRDYINIFDSWIYATMKYSMPFSTVARIQPARD